MPVDVAVYIVKGNNRSERIAALMQAGIEACGDTPVVRMDYEYPGIESAEPVAVFYGYENNTPRIMDEYISSGRKAVFIDLGYWGRRDGGRYNGFHKIAVNARHPTEYFQANQHDAKRAQRFELKVHPWRGEGRHILVAGMSDRCALSIGMQPEEWERAAIEELKRHTSRPIVYRPKPSWRTAEPIEGAEFSSQNEPLRAALKNCHAVVTHHSNVAVDGLVLGIPAFAWDGVAKPMALQDLSRIETPVFPEGREQWIADIAYCQWNADEMRSGAAWKHLKRDGLIP